MAQDFWASSGYRHLRKGENGWHEFTDDYLRLFLARDELAPPPEAGPAERHLHARLAEKPRLAVTAADLAAVEDADARDNWREWLRLRDRLLEHGTVEACYVDLFRRPAVDLAPAFVDALAQAIVRSLLEGTSDPWYARAGELFFRRQRVSLENGQVLAADATTIEAYAETGGFGNFGRLLRQQATPVAPVKMDVLNAENAPLDSRHELFSFLLDLTPGARVRRRSPCCSSGGSATFRGARVRIEPGGAGRRREVASHAGLDVESTAILTRCTGVRRSMRSASRASRVSSGSNSPTPRMPRRKRPGRPVYLGLAFREDHTLKMKPQNLLVNLPSAGRADARRGVK